MNKQEWWAKQDKKEQDESVMRALKNILDTKDGHIKLGFIMSNALRGKLQLKCAMMSIIECPIGTVNITTRDEDRKILEVKMKMPNLKHKSVLTELNKTVDEAVDKLYKLRQKVVKKTKQLITLTSVEVTLSPDRSYFVAWEEVLVKKL